MDINQDTWNQLMEQADYILVDEQPAQKSAPAEVEITELIEPTVAQTNVEGAFSDIVSEGMFLGMNGSILKDVEGDLGQMPKGIPMESLNETRNLVENYLK